MKTMKEFYPFYRSQHQNSICRMLHVIGTLTSLFFIAICLYQKNFLALFFAPVIGYGMAWIGHFVFEKNRPATFKYPFLSFASDFVLLFNVLTGKESIQIKKTEET